MIYRKAFISEVIEKIKETDGTNAKIEILRSAIAETPYFKEYLKWVFAPNIRYHIKKIPEYKKHPEAAGEFGIGRIFEKDMLAPLYTRKVTGGKASDYLQYLLECLNDYDAKALEMLIARNIDCGISSSSINKVVPGLVPAYPVMLCSAFSEKAAEEFTFPAYSQIKMDGLRGNIVNRKGDITTFSRNGKELGLDEVFSFIGKDSWSGEGEFVLDGEVLVRSEDGKSFLPRKKGNGIINKCAKGTASKEEMDRVVFVAWDAIPLKNFDDASEWAKRYANRFDALRTIVENINSPKLILIESKIVQNLKEAKDHFAEVVGKDQPDEGTILKTLDGTWAPGRPKTQLKLKCERECELRIIRMIEGNGKYRGKLGALLGESQDGLIRVSVGSGLSDEDREVFWKDDVVGKIMSVRYNERITNSSGDNSLFLPRFLEIRFDKDTADMSEAIE